MSSGCSYLQALAVLGLTRADALDYGAKGIRINCVCPGWIRTNMTEELATSPIVSYLNPMVCSELT